MVIDKLYNEGKKTYKPVNVFTQNSIRPIDTSRIINYDTLFVSFAQINGLACSEQRAGPSRKEIFQEFETGGS